MLFHVTISSNAVVDEIILTFYPLNKILLVGGSLQEWNQGWKLGQQVRLGGSEVLQSGHVDICCSGVRLLRYVAIKCNVFKTKTHILSVRPRVLQTQELCW